MKRRILLAIAAGSAASLVGCLDPSSDDGTATDTEGPGDRTPTDDSAGGGTETATEDRPVETPTDDPQGTDGTAEPDDETPTETADGTPGEPRLVDQDLEVQSVGCRGSGEDYWEVEVDDGVVTVDGAIGGNHTCYSARIASAEYVRDEDALRTAVESFDDREDGEACNDCIVDVFYRATYTFEDGEPGDVEVQHDGYSGS